jgi:hypothetical protein
VNQQRVLIPAEDKFGPPGPPSFPEITLEEFKALGITAVETDEMLMVEVPFLAQKKLVENVKQFGFGASQALDEMIKRILRAAGITGKFEMSADPKTFMWRAWVKKKRAA